jgi:hypothetical protein
MTTINRLSSTDTLSAGDLLPVYVQNAGDARKASMDVLLTFIQDNIALPQVQLPQYAAPSATGFSVTLQEGSTWLILSPTGSFANGTLVLPSDPQDNDSITVSCTQNLTVLAITSAKTVTNAPTAFAAATRFFTIRFDAVTDAWYRTA